jgi:hypothetical protein
MVGGALGTWVWFYTHASGHGMPQQYNDFRGVGKKLSDNDVWVGKFLIGGSRLLRNSPEKV